MPTQPRPERPAHVVRQASVRDVGELLTLQRAAFVSEAQQYGDPLLPPLRDGTAQVRSAVSDPACTFLVLEARGDGTHGRAGRLLGSAQLWVDPAQGPAVDRAGQVARVVVAPDLQGAGLGSVLLMALHAAADGALGLQRLELFTGADSERNLGFYRRHGYRDVEVRRDDHGVPVQVLHRQAAPQTT